VVALFKDRARTLNELADEAMLFYAPAHLHEQRADENEALLAQHLTGPSREAVRAFADGAGAITWERNEISLLLKRVLGALSLKMPQLAVPLRVVVTGRTQTPSIDAVLELFGRERVLARIERALRRGAERAS
jgi:glutamyl-tRNA synthetase